ncbi:MAG: acetyl-CoA hydrolase/transferase family protein [bacterium]|nr:acetyl-CoA hydrolase/transferase family protein [bacterium]
MDWKQDYENKKVSVAKAINKIKTGDNVYAGHASTISLTLMHEMCNQADRLKDIQIFMQLPLTEIEYIKPEMEESFHTTFLFANGAPVLDSIRKGKSDFIAENLSELPKIFLKGAIDIDVVFVQVSRPNELGMCSFGVGVMDNYALIETSKHVIAEVNSNMPFSESATIPISKLDQIVESSDPMVSFPVTPIDELSLKIGKYIADLIPDRANLQVGIGSIPNAVLKSLKNKKDLGIHSEMISDGVMELVKEGIINSKYNNLNPGKIVVTFLIGSQNLYDWMHYNSKILLKPSNYTNDIRNAGRVDNLMAINSALQVDLTGQVNAEMIGSRQISGVGGQSDFIKSAMLSEGGKSFIALPSTAKGETISRIVARLDEGACVTTPRHDVQYIVTEYGVAYLYGKTMNQRAEALIKIAHPKFREELMKSIKK